MEQYEIKQLVEDYSDMIMRISYQHCFNKTDCEDITQEVFIKLIKNKDKLKQKQDYIKNWIIRVTINLCKDYNKSAWYRKVDKIKETESDYCFDTEELEILKEISKLKPVYRDIIYLYYYEGYKINEISKQLNLKENTVSSNLTRARKKLKNILEERGDNNA